MAYNKTNWTNGQAPALNAQNLNKIEDGIEAAHNSIAEIGAIISGSVSGTIPSSTSAYSALGEAISLPAGTWKIETSVRFASLGASGAKFVGAQIYTDIDGNYAAVASSRIQIRTEGTPNIITQGAASSDHDFNVKIYAAQNSGSAMTVTAYYSAVRIK